jgi:hypothetical protein
MQLNLFYPKEDYKELSGTTQVCKVCSKEKDSLLFYKHINNTTGIDTRCKACVKKERKIRKVLRYKYMHLKTDLCDCCGNKHHKSLVLDHDHNTHKFRGWLCEPCNQGIGKLGDDIKGLEKSMAYMKRHYG